MRVIDGLIPEEGTVKVCMNAVWSSVCQSSWDYKDAFVVCHNLDTQLQVKMMEYPTCLLVVQSVCTLTGSHRYSILP